MGTSGPPPVASWLLRHFGPAYCRESLIGDLLEQYAVRQSPGWYWREVGAALWVNLRAFLHRSVLPVAATLTASWAVLIVGFWSVDALALRWILVGNPFSGVASAIGWCGWISMLSLAYAAAGGVIGRVSSAHRASILVGLLAALPESPWPITGHLIHHIMARTPGLSHDEERAVEMVVAVVGVLFGFCASRRIARHSV